MSARFPRIMQIPPYTCFREKDGAGILQRLPLLCTIVVFVINCVVVDVLGRNNAVGVVIFVRKEDKTSYAVHGGFGISGVRNAIHRGSVSCQEKIFGFVLCQCPPSAGCVSTVGDGIIHAPVGESAGVGQRVFPIIARTVINIFHRYRPRLIAKCATVPSARTPAEKVNPSAEVGGDRAVILANDVILVFGKTPGALGQAIGGLVLAGGAVLKVALREPYLPAWGNGKQSV